MRLRSWLDFRLRTWLGLSRLRSRSGSWLSAALARRGGLRSRRRLSCGLSWCSRGLSRSFSRPLGRLCRRRRGRTCRCRLGTIRLRVCGGRSRSRSSTSRNYRSDRFALRDWLGRHNNGRTSVIDGSKLLTVLCGLLPLLYLRCHRGNALLACCSEFRRQRTARDASRPSVAGAACSVVNRGVVDDRIRYRAVVYVNVGDGHVVDRAVVVETIAAPIPALISDACVTIPIINAAIVADMRAPIAVVVTIRATRISPVSRRP